jgi:hypothetical protein
MVFFLILLTLWMILRTGEGDSKLMQNRGGSEGTLLRCPCQLSGNHIFSLSDSNAGRMIVDSNFLILQNSKSLSSCCCHKT